eukprot:TRINITY_DN6221_c1_g3_i1.p1 TRINITY_DN6221_c1_g3~~TRINITY_DN6221_c1_g3_i1.p1  ORF type:complete len:685 (-),score=161.23 TRINITY_DN6221_c1_g3_i1:74-2128(-)
MAESSINNNNNSSSSNSADDYSQPPIMMGSPSSSSDAGGASSSSSRRVVSDNALELEWNDITIKSKGGNKKLLNSVSGRVKGRFLAIMGGSGSGKTTLLNFLARRLDRRAKVSGGASTLQGGTYDQAALKKVSGYVMQDDLLFANLTVYETLMYAARLRLPDDLTKAEIEDRINNALEQLGISHCRDTIIGDTIRRGVSGGERKRVCVAIELLMNPSVLLLDEPTSGLDSSSSLSLCKTLSDLAATGSCTVITTIHQPQSKIFELFDDLIILNKGKVVYRGPRNDVVPFYERAGLPLPPFTNPADHIIDVITFVPGANVDELARNCRRLQNQLKLDEAEQEKARQAEERASPRTPRPQKLEQSHSQYLMKLDTEHDEEEEDGDEGEHANMLKDLHKFVPEEYPRTSWWNQFRVLLARTFHDTLRDKSTLFSQIILNFIMAILIGGVYFQIGTDQSSIVRRNPMVFFCVINQGTFGAMIVINNFPSERKIILRERAAGSYFVSAYYTAKILIEMAVQVGLSIIFSCIVYWMAGLQPVASKFFAFMFFMILCSLGATSTALLISAICRTTTLAVSILPFMLEITRLFGGLYVTPATIHPGFVVFDALSYTKYAYVGGALNELKDLTLTCTPAQLNAQGKCPVTSGQQTIDQLGLDKFPISLCMGILFLYVVLCRVGAFVAIRYIKW